jgi:transposase
MDPLRPFALLIRQLTRPRANVAHATDGAASTPERTTQAPQAPLSDETQLMERLRRRLRDAGEATAARRREYFVEAVLLQDFAARAALDGELSQLVARVARDLGEDEQLAARLDQLLVKLNRR